MNKYADVKYVIGLSFLFLTSQACAQNTLRNALYLEFGGNAGFYSINYERTFPKNAIGRIGFSVLPGDLILPILAGKYFGKRSNHIELMGGVTYGYYRKVDATDVVQTSDEFLGTVVVGYRYQKPERRFLFRVGYSPFINFHRGSLQHWAGLSAGYRF
jgi:hypothetical protein